MSNAGKGWLAFGIIAVCGVVIASCAIANTSASPRPFLRDNYKCVSDPTDVDYTTCDYSGSQQSVVNEISKDVQPIDTETDDGDYLEDNGTGDTYLQYEDDIVVVSSGSDGRAFIEVDEYDDAYHRHSHVIGGFGWSSTGGKSGGGGWGGGFGGK